MGGVKVKPPVLFRVNGKINVNGNDINSNKDGWQLK